MNDLTGSTVQYVVLNVDAELQAIEVISNALSGLGPEEAGRVLRYVNDRWGDA